MSHHFDNPTPLAYADPERHSHHRMAMSQWRPNVYNSKLGNVGGYNVYLKCKFLSRVRENIAEFIESIEEVPHSYLKSQVICHVLTSKKSSQGAGPKIGIRYLVRC
ncbi:hypothetical protein TNIN_474231 [Trichonephila inaurata madagascariensis]|uniref:Uncharacterized protein n=1 Tax=Trichonephila inaurata madagascariensis TaxID=2747483 RepID=A0A8X6WPA2_9ARAC|nr:hypothetical protein TNIN_474231 [Trichonephila inaurata madagascariensis]